MIGKTLEVGGNDHIRCDVCSRTLDTGQVTLTCIDGCDWDVCMSCVTSDRHANIATTGHGGHPAVQNNVGHDDGANGGIEYGPGGDVLDKYGDKWYPGTVMGVTANTTTIQFRDKSYVEYPSADVAGHIRPPDGPATAHVNWSQTAVPVNPRKPDPHSSRDRTVLHPYIGISIAD